LIYVQTELITCTLNVCLEATVYVLLYTNIDLKLRE